jgi:cell division protein FtsB
VTDDATGSAPRGRKSKGSDDETTGSAPRGRKSKGSDDETGSGPRTSKVQRWSALDGESGALRRPPPEPSGPVSRDDTPPFGRRRHGRFAVGTVAVLVVAALVAALFVLPVQAWLGQRRALAESNQQLDVIWAENKRLDGLYDQLQTDAVVEQQAREQFGLIKPGELPLSVLPAPPATALPAGWPFDQLQAILWVRTAAAAAADGSASPSPTP